MNILVINGHPDKQSFSAAITKSFLSGIDEKRHSVTSLNLGELEFDPVLRYGYREHMPYDKVISQSQELIKWADHFVFIYPVWWSSMPSLMKGWIDRVFTPGIAYSSNDKGSFIKNILTNQQFKKLLKGRTSEIIVTSTAPSWWYKTFSGFINIPDSYGVSVLKNAVLSHCGIKNKKVMVLGEMGRETNTLELRENFLKKVYQRAQKL